MDDINLGSALICYTCKNSSSYDPIFDQLIREIRPDWFQVAAQTKKDQLIEMAKNGKKRPNCKHSLYYALYNYTSKNHNSYDPEFDQIIRELRPDWFEDATKIKKNQLIEMAKNGEKRPNCKHSLYYALYGYTSKNHNSYDTEFDMIIRELRPDWFVQLDALRVARNNRS